MLDETTRANLRSLYRKSKKEFETLRIDLTIDGERLRNLYGAGRRFDGFPDYYRNFLRDSVFSLLLTHDSEFARDLLTLAISTQGKTRNPFTGEVPGKFFHEYPGVTIGRKNTLFNAIDANPLYLILLERYLGWTGDWDFCLENREAHYLGVTYIINQISRSIYWEDPANADAKRFALPATCWRDGGIAGRRKKSLVYPAAFTLVQAQTIAALRSAASIATRCDIGYSSETLERFSSDLLAGLLNDFWDAKTSSFPIAIDGRGKIFAPYSDALHVPFYLERGDLPDSILDSIFSFAAFLETPYGYLTYREEKKRRREFIDHKIWPWEAPFIAEAALRCSRPEIAEKAFRVVNGMVQCERSFCEWLNYDGTENICRQGGCDTQLWSVASVVGLHRLFQQYRAIL